MVRRLFTRLLVISLCVCVVSAQTRRLGARIVGSGSTLFTPADFTVDGFYNLNLSGGTYYGNGLTHRTVAGQLNFLTYDHPNTVREWTTAGASFGDTITTTINYWAWDDQCNDVVGADAAQFHGVWFDETSGLLWTTASRDYGPTGNIQLCTHVLHASNHTMTNHGPVGLTNYLNKQLYGGVDRTPTWFRSAYSAPEFVGGWGGYASTANGSSLGLATFFFPDISGYSDSTQIPDDGTFKVGALHDSQTVADWYGGGVPTTGDRGRRLSEPANYMEETFPADSQQRVTLSGTVTTNGTAVTWVSEGLSRQWDRCRDITTDPIQDCWWVGNGLHDFTINSVNYEVASITSNTVLQLTTSAGVQASPVDFITPTTRPTAPIETPAEWLSPAPDGYARFVWGDRYGSGCKWITKDAKHGIVCLPVLFGGTECDIDAVGKDGCVWYANAILLADKTLTEWHIFNPNDLGAVIQGSMDPWEIQPSSMGAVSLSGVDGGSFNHSTVNPVPSAGLDYDPVSGKAYLIIFGGSGASAPARLYVLSVDGTVSPAPVIQTPELVLPEMVALPEKRVE